MTQDAKTYYEKNQSFNPIVRWLHSIRYKYLIELFDQIQSENLTKTIKVVDIGCAHAKTFGLLNERYKISYVGIELDRTFAETAAKRYGQQPNFRVINDTIENHYSELENIDFIISLETLEHIPEHIVVRLIEKIADCNPKCFICSVPNEVGPIVWIKNIGSVLMGYMRHTEYKWRETFYAGIYELDKVETHGTGHKGFDWRWLAQTIRHNRKITRTLSSPFRWLPKTLSVSVIFISSRSE
ncbi:MAG: class I SAM-dependent methyltransferase [Methylomicrobium sp.]|nr:class I SAM-dependent methyltransferase [Methylomicrobium sp.]